jgi:hypothetical protein
MVALNGYQTHNITSTTWATHLKVTKLWTSSKHRQQEFMQFSLQVLALLVLVMLLPLGKKRESCGIAVAYGV